MGELRATATVEAQVKRHLLEVTAREAKRRAEDVKSARDLADLQRRLGGALGRADKAEAKIGALTESLSESRSDLRRKVASLRRTIGTGEERLREIQDAKASSSSASSSATTYTEDEVEEMETVMGDLTAQLAEVKKLRKHDEAEYDRTRQAVAGFRLKYLARRTPRNNLALHSQVQLLTAERDERGPPPLIPLASLVSQVISSTSGGTRPRRWAPSPLFADLITPAMLDTGATSEQINKVTSFVPPSPPLFYLFS